MTKTYEIHNKRYKDTRSHSRRILDLKGNEDLNVSKSKKKSGRKYTLFTTLFYILIFIFSFYLASVYFDATSKGESFTQTIKNQFIAGVEIFNDVLKPNIKMSEERFISFLIMGVDTRFPEIEDGQIKGREGFEDVNTDTLMQIVYDYGNNNLFLISMPRDLGIEYTDECVAQFDTFHPRKSINHIYKFGNMGDCEGGGIEMLKKYVYKITGFPVHYYAMINLESFLEIIEVIGDEHEGEKGLWIDIPEIVSSYYPNEYWGYDYVFIDKGFQFLNSKDLLIYSRVRAGSNDFERVRRQHQVIEAVEQKLLDVEQYKDPLVALDLINELSSEVLFSPVGFDEVRTAVELLDKIKNAEVYKLVLDNDFGGEQNELLMTPFYGVNGVHHVNGYYLIPSVWENPEYTDDKFKEVKNQIRKIIESPASFKELRIEKD